MEVLLSFLGVALLALIVAGIAKGTAAMEKRKLSNRIVVPVVSVGLVVLAYVFLAYMVYLDPNNQLESFPLWPKTWLAGY